MTHEELVDALALKLMDERCMRPEQSLLPDRQANAAAVCVHAYSTARRAIATALEKFAPDVPGGKPPRAGSW
jgi:hypothetical protein